MEVIKNLVNPTQHGEPSNKARDLMDEIGSLIALRDGWEETDPETGEPTGVKHLSYKGLEELLADDDRSENAELERDSALDEVDKLKEENKKIKEENEKCTNCICNMNDVIEELKEENKKLTEENENWEADDANLTKVMSMVDEELGDDRSWEGVDDIIDIIKELKEEVKETTKQNGEMCEFLEQEGFVVCECDKWGRDDEDFSSGRCPECQGDYEDDEVDFYIDSGRKVVLKDARVLHAKD